MKDPYAMTCDTIQNENVPLTDSYVKVLYPDLEWDLIKWGPNSIEFGDTEILGLLNYKFYPIKIIANADIISLD